MRPLRIIFLADTRPGHYHIAQGVITALSRLRPVEVTRIEVQRKWIVPTRWLRARINAKTFYPPRMLRMAYRIEAEALPEADLVVSAGGETQMPNICVTRLLGVPNIFCGSLLRGLEPENFSLIISSYDRDATSEKHLVVLKPSSLDPEELGRPEIVPRFGPDRRPEIVGLLIGGRAGRFHYTRREWERLLSFAAEVSKAWGTRWLISTSRRTPDKVADRIAELAHDGSVVAKFIDFRTAGPGTLPEIFAQADAIVCTEDFELHDLRGRLGTAARGRRGAQAPSVQRGREGLSGVSHEERLVPRAANRGPVAGDLRPGALGNRADPGEPARRARRETESAPASALLSAVFALLPSTSYIELARAIG